MENRQNEPTLGAKLDGQAFRILMENSQDAIFLLGEGGKILETNRRVEELLGCQRNRIEGRGCLEFVFAGDLDYATRNLEEVFRGRESETKPIRLARSNGQTVSVRFSAIPIDLEGRRVVVAIGRDVTNQLNAEKEHLLLASIVESSGDAIFGSDMEGIINTWNPAAQGLYGYGPEEILGRSLATLLPLELRAEHFKRLEACKKGETIPSPFEGTHLTREGARVEVSLTVSLLREADGQLKGISIIARDVTEKKKTEISLRKREEAVREAEKMEAVGQLAAGVAHDFNNLLAVIRGNGDFLMSELPQGDPLRDDVGEILGAVRHGANLTKQLLLFGRKDVFQPELLCLGDVISETQAMLRSMVHENVEVILKTAPGLGVVRGDPTHIQQILMNLCGNSKDAMPEGGRLLIETRNLAFEEDHQIGVEAVPAGDYVLLSVSDTGAGMDLTVQEHIFEPFFTTKEKGKGTGLGLATVYNVVKKGGGYIWVRSAPGKGTTFNIAFPAQKGNGAKAPTARLQKNLEGSEIILLVEDEAGLRRTTARSLEKKGYRVLQAADGDEGLKCIAQHDGKIDLILTDVIMPRLGGKDLARIMRQIGPRVKVLFMSGYPREILSNEDGTNWAADLIQKPFSMEDLLARIRAAFDKKAV